LGGAGVSLDTALELGGHLHRSRQGLEWLGSELDRIRQWGSILRLRLDQGGRLLVAGNGGSAALAHHLAGELVGRYDRERPPYSGIVLTADPAALTAIGNDYGYDEVFARQVAAHGRPGDVLVELTTSGRSRNLLRAAAEGRRRGLVVWAMTGPGPNPLSALADDALAVACDATPSIQDVQQVAVHLLCLAFELAGERG
jgi:phosphoheptose isomerase